MVVVAGGSGGGCGRGGVGTSTNDTRISIMTCSNVP